MRIFLGIDGGGTGCRALLADENGAVIGRGSGPSTNYHHAGWHGAETALHSTVEDAWKSAGLSPRPATAAFCGLAGLTSSPDRERFRHLAHSLGLAEKIDIDHDIRIALAGGLAGRPGIALIAGTGSACYGRRADGTNWQAGGWDAVADDVGSSYWLGSQAINRAVRAMDERDPSTILQQIVFDHFQIKQPDEIMQRLSGLPRHEIATLAPMVLQAAATDTTADEICEKGADELALMVATVARKISATPLEAITAGSLGLAPDYQRRIRQALARRTSLVQMIEAVLPPVAGAVVLAAELAGQSPTPEFFQSLNA